MRVGESGRNDLTVLLNQKSNKLPKVAKFLVG